MSSYQLYFLMLHSFLRYVVLALTAIVAVQSFLGMSGKKEFQPGNRKMALFLFISCDLQLLAGLASYYLGGYLLMLKNGSATADKQNLFFAIEHPLSMVIAIVLVHIGYGVTKQAIDSRKKFKKLFWYSFIALLLFVSQTPWPGRKNKSRPLFRTAEIVKSPAAIG